ncbi:OmpW family protein [Geitlerinema sp. PCC 9228]|jgi:outer membrane protein|uniref:OmpW/AlkL family protein n=1 Tax=Geitlerinema sp. PCC 9228 TaxID=111611 RepID=UPI0008F9BF5B|nr:OmpW family protein [Geitlerinema sp. PCC 9228]
MQKKQIALAGTTFLALFLGIFPASPGVAQEFKPKEAGDILIRLRGIGVIPDEDSDLTSNDIDISGEARVDDDYVPELDISYFFTDNLAVELILATTRHDVEAIDTPLGDADLGEVQLLPPTLTLQYHFLSQERFSPYVGTGVNYTIFFDEEDGDATNIEYDDRFAFALQIGADYAIVGNWSLNFDVKKIFLDTEVDVSVGGTDVDADVGIDPWIFSIGVGYRF